jgi:PAS domain S-box-containing protein
MNAHLPSSAGPALPLSVRLARAAGLTVAAIAAIDLVALLLGSVDRLDALVGFPMRANTAVALVCDGLALALLSGASSRAATIAARVLSTVGLLIGVVTLIEHAIGVDLWIDELLVRDVISATAPGRIGIVAAADIAAVSVGLLCLDVRSRWIAQSIAVATALAAISVLVGAWYGSTPFWTTDRLARVPVLAAMEVTLLAVGLVLARPHHGIVHLLSRDTMASQLARRLMPVAIGGPLVLGWLVATGSRAEWFSSPFGNTAFALICAGGFLLMTLAMTSWLNRTETRANAERKSAEAELRTSFETNRQILNALREAEERTDFALISAQIGVWELDLETLRMRSTQAMAAVCRRTAEELERSDFIEFLHADDRTAVVELRDHAIRERRPFECECRLLWPDGTMRSMHLTAFIAPAAEGRRARLVGVMEDITDRRSLEAQLQQAQKMEAVGQLAGGIAHDFNNLLTAILGYTRMLQEDLADSEQLRDLEQIEKAAERAAGLTRQLLAFSRRQIVEPHNLDLDAIVRDIVPMLRRLVGEQIELTMGLALAGARIYADRGQIEQVIMNLVVNARDAMPGGGRIRIETAILQFAADSDLRGKPLRPGRYALLAISDSGHGMTEDVQQHLFEPFFTTKEAGKGTGLGLATVYGIVQQSRGHITVYSEVNHGSTFKVYFPVSQPAVTGDASRSAIASRRSSRGEVVLVVEDEDAVRRLTAVILERAGYQVFQASGPKEAEDAFSAANGQIDVLVTDIVMPGGTGLDLYRRLKRSHVKLRALFMSGYPGEVGIAQEQLESAAAFLQKPFAADVLVGKLREVLDR